MNLKKKIGMAMASTALGAMLLGAGTYAIFTDSVSNTQNTFTAGTVDLNLNAESQFTGTINNLAPGDSGQQTFDLVNNGSLELRYDIAQTLQSGANTLVQGDAAQDLRFTIEYSTDNGTTWAAVTPGDNNIVMAPGATHKYRVNYLLPLAADNDYQGKSSNFQLTFNAEQTRNN
jgi:predicted ribosomally synthesized peptide with SipW-like signal peptide